MLWEYRRRQSWMFVDLIKDNVNCTVNRYVGEQGFNIKGEQVPIIVFPM